MTLVHAESSARTLAPGTGRLLLDISRSVLSPHLRDHRVAVTVDGYPWRFAWGRTWIDLPVGRHDVEIEVEHVGGWGRVADAVPVAAGHTVEAYYRAPALPRLAGALGPRAQRTRGAVVCAVLAVTAGTALAGLLALLVVGLVGLAG